jgi:hypothetical protein
MNDISFPKGDPAAHAELVRGMVKRTGVSLGERVVDGRLTNEALGTLLDRCCQCSKPASCKAWQADNPGPVDAAPEYCLNGDRFAEMLRDS